MHDEPSTTSHTPVERKLTTILCADVAGYSDKMGRDEERTVQVLRGHRELFEGVVAQHRGRVFNTAGDALLVEFVSAVEAVRCATEVQAALRTRNEHLPPEARMQFRIGINLGDVIVQGDDLLGDGVNVAARLQAACVPGGTCISGSVHDLIQSKLSLEFRALGERSYKNIARPVRTYLIGDEGRPPVAPRRVGPVVGAVLALLLGGGYLWLTLVSDGKPVPADTPAGEKTAEAPAAPVEAASDRSRVSVTAGEAAPPSARATETAVEPTPAETVPATPVEAATARSSASASDEGAIPRTRDSTGTVGRPRPSEAPAVTSPVREVARPPAGDGDYRGRLCNDFLDRPQSCWGVELAVGGGKVEATWLSRSGHASRATGTLADDGRVMIEIAGWTFDGRPHRASLRGQLTGDELVLFGQWRDGTAISGTWTRLR